MLASVSKRNLTSYSQYLTFFKAFKTPRHSRLVASYFFSALDQIPLSYLDGWLQAVVCSCVVGVALVASATGYAGREDGDEYQS